MASVATPLTTVAVVLAALLLAPTAASAAGCEVVADPGQRADCIARAHAREAARAEVQRSVGGDGVATAGAVGDPHTAAWSKALAESSGFHPGDALQLRPLAAIVGLAWFAFAVRLRWRGRRRGGPSTIV